MTRIHTAILITAPVERVFDYATTPANWPKWHPASKAVRGAVDHSLEPGERLVEEIATTGYRGSATWIVRERTAPRRWVIEGEGDGGGQAWLTYTLTPESGGTHFERELVYRMSNAWLALLDLLFIRRRMASDSEQALKRLKAVLEASAPEPEGGASAADATIAR
jgi:uncharacterized protein YndB with AHSA1/START domain